MDWFLRKVAGWLSRRGAKQVAGDPRLTAQATAMIRVDLHGECAAVLATASGVVEEDEVGRLCLHFYARVLLLLGIQEKPFGEQYQGLLRTSVQQVMHSNPVLSGWEPHVCKQVQLHFAGSPPGPVAEFKATLYAPRYPTPTVGNFRHVVVEIPETYRLSESVLAVLVLLETVLRGSSDSAKYRLECALGFMNTEFKVNGWGCLTPETSKVLPTVAYEYGVKTIRDLGL